MTARRRRLWGRRPRSRTLRRHLSLRARLVVLTWGAIVVAMSLASAAMIAETSVSLSRQLDDQLSRDVNAIVVRASDRGPSAVIDDSAAKSFFAPPPNSSLVTLWFDESTHAVDEEVPFDTGPLLTVDPKVVAAASSSRIDLLDIATAQGTYRAALSHLEHSVALGRKNHPTRLMGAVAVVASTASTRATLQSVVAIVAGGLLIAATVAALGATVAARRGLRPLRQLRDAAAGARLTEDLEARLPLPGTGDDLDDLAAALNQALDEAADAYGVKEGAIARQREFVADASHDLRTPLTTVRTDIELVLGHPRMPVASRREALSEALAEVDRMDHIVGDLLALSTADARDARVSTLRWNDVVAALETDARRICGPRPMTWDADADLAVTRGDAADLGRCLRILCENVVLHTDADVPVDIRVRATGRGVTLTVADGGPGVPAALLPRIFDRFVRGDQARGGRGNGLGLAIVARLLELHGGTHHASRSPLGGLAVELSWPRLIGEPGE